MSAQTCDEYYIYQPHYKQLKELARMISDYNVDNNTIINYIKEHKLDPNSYITTFIPDLYVPLIFRVSQLPYEKRLKLTCWLLKHGADLTKKPDSSDSQKIDDIMFVCNERYLTTFTKNGCKINKDILHLSIIRKLHYAGIKRIQLLCKLGLMDSHMVYEIAQKNSLEILPKMLDTLLDRVYFISKTTNIKDHVDHTINQFADTISYLRVSATTVLQEQNITVAQFCTNYYLHQLLTRMKEINLVKSQLKVTYHEDMNPKIVAKLRHLLNDRRYVETCDFLEQEPEKRAY